ncbi:MAG: GNAT family N-acetyltransferase [Planctomycetota bacterium]
MNQLRVTIATEPNTKSESFQCVFDWLREHNWQAAGTFMQAMSDIGFAAAPLILTAQIDGNVIGGVVAETQLAWLKTSILSVDPNHRRLGVGTKLMNQAESIAIQRGCRHAYVDTLSHQAPEFYQSIGYQVAGEIDDWDSHGHTKLFLTKQLDDQ